MCTCLNNVPIPEGGGVHRQSGQVLGYQEPPALSRRCKDAAQQEGKADAGPAGSLQHALQRAQYAHARINTPSMKECGCFT